MLRQVLKSSPARPVGETVSGSIARKEKREKENFRSLQKRTAALLAQSS